MKPRLRGVSHQVAFFVSLVAGGLLVAACPPGQHRVAALVYSISLSAMFGISALYHRPNWAPAARQRMRRLDHSAIFLLIGGTYTPVWLLVLSPRHVLVPLWVVWAGVAAGVLQSLIWIKAPRALTAAIYVAVGWISVADWRAFSAGMGASEIVGILLGGVFYTGGAIIYARKRPDPAPTVFGYHEIFHALVIAAAACHFWVIRRVLLGGV